MSIIAQITAARIEQGITASQLAEKVGIGRSAMSQIESGRVRPRVETLEKLCSVLGCELKIQPRRKK